MLKGDNPEDAQTILERKIQTKRPKGSCERARFSRDGLVGLNGLGVRNANSECLDRTLVEAVVP